MAERVLVERSSRLLSAANLGATWLRPSRSPQGEFAEGFVEFFFRAIGAHLARDLNEAL
jgi:hypothetical protein